MQCAMFSLYLWWPPLDFDQSYCRKVICTQQNRVWVIYHHIYITGGKRSDFPLNRVRVLYISGSLEDIFLLLIAMLLRQLFTKCIECHSQKDQAERGARTSSAQRPHGRRGTRGGVQRKVRCYIDWLKSWGKITVKVGFENINDSPFSLSYHFLTKWKTCTCSISTV